MHENLAKLIAVSGPLRGTVFDLSMREVSIGRDPSNLINPPDKSLSRKHCVLKQRGSQIVVIDLDSRNGTFVNDIPIREQVLNHADRLRLGASYFLVLLQADERQDISNSVEFADDDPHTLSVATFNLEDALFSMVRDLNVLRKVSSSIGSITSAEKLQTAVIDALFEVTPAARGVILIAGETIERPASVYAIDRVRGPVESISISRTVVTQVLSKRVALLSNDASPASFADTDSLLNGHVRSLLCVPMILSNKITGLIYLDTHRQSQFDESHLRTATMISAMAAGALERIGDIERLKSENKHLRAELHSGHRMIGDSDAIRRVLEIISRVAARDSTVLIVGESGTGKELVAREIHNRSVCATGPFVAVNCATLSESLLESDLFGHEKGAFTGAITQKKGKFEFADGGTIFLDELGEMPPQVQAKLLRVLQEGEFERVGGIRSIRSNVRVIAATNRDLKQALKSGGFREDLYYRLNVVQLTVPPLRERRDDILLLANYFISKHSEKCKRVVTGLSDAARSCLLQYDWPGNVRELENAIEHAIVLGSSEHVEVEDLPDQVMETAVSLENQSSIDYQSLVQNAKRQILLNAIESTNGNYSAAARLLGIHPKNLHRLIRSAGLRGSSGESQL
jgi:Nif-specific regulatory protein